MDTYGRRLNEALLLKNKTAQWLADALGISRQAVGQVINGKTNSLTAANHELAAHVLSINGRWLANGEGMMIERGVEESKLQGLRGVGSAGIPNAFKTIAQALAQVDDITREQTKPIFDALIKNPDRTDELLARLLKTLKT